MGLSIVEEAKEVFQLHHRRVVVCLVLGKEEFIGPFGLFSTLKKRLSNAACVGSDRGKVVFPIDSAIVRGRRVRSAEWGSGRESVWAGRATLNPI